MSSSPTPVGVTCTTLPPSPLRVSVGVVQGVLMPARAVSFSGVTDSRGPVALSLLVVLTSSTRSSARAGNKVFSGQGMATLAVGATGVLRCDRLAAQVVHARGHGLQVQWVDTPSNSAKVIQFEALGNWTNKLSVRDRVRGIRATKGTPPKLCVPPCRATPCPQPAARDRVNLDFFPEALRQSNVTEQCGTIEHIDSNQSVTPRGVCAPAGLLPVIVPAVIP